MKRKFSPEAVQLIELLRLRAAGKIDLETFRRHLPFDIDR